MNGFRLLAACFAVSLSTTSAAADVTVYYAESLQRLAITGDAPAGLGKPAAAGPVRVTFDAFGRTFDLALEPNHRLLSDAARESLTGAAKAYRGSVAGRPDSWSRIVLAGGVPRGLIRDGAELYAIEPSSSGEAVIYRLEDLYVPPGSVSCGADAGNAAALYGNVVGELGKTMAKAGAVSQISLGAIGDYELFSSEGPGSEVAILTRLNNVDGIFSEQLGVRIYVDDVRIFTGAEDPFSNTQDAHDLLGDVAAYRKGNARQRSHALTHLFTGRNLQGSTVGIAYNGTLCDAEWGVGLTQLGGNVTFDSLVAAHEIGHNFGAPHDGEPGSACAAETGHFLMSTSINGSDELSSCSIRQIEQHLQRAYCVAPVPTVDAEIALPGGLPATTLGAAVTARFDVANGGTGAATDVRVEIMLPANASFSTASASQGSCTDGAGAVICDIGSIPAGSNRLVTLEMTAAEVGSAELEAVVDVVQDDDPGNNTLAATLRVDPAMAPESEAPSATVKSAASGKGGGGAAGLLWLVLLGAAAWRDRRLARGRALAHDRRCAREPCSIESSWIGVTPAAGWRRKSRAYRPTTR